MRILYSAALLAIHLLLGMQSVWAMSPDTSIKTALLKEILQARTHQFPATVMSQNVSQLSSDIASTILQIDVRPGDTVVYGQKLITLDCRDSEDQLSLLQSRLNETQVTLIQAQRLSERLRSLQERQLSDSLSAEDAQSEVLRQQARLSATETELQIAKRNTERCFIYAPYDAAITAQFAYIGERTSPGMPLLQLQQLSDAELEVQLPIHRFEIDADMQAIFQLNGEQHKVTFLRASPVVNAETRSQTVWFRAPDSVDIGRSGTLVIDEDKLFIPANLIIRRQNQLGIFIVKDSQPVFYPLTDAQEGRPYPVPEDLIEHTIVTQGHQWLAAESNP